MKRLLVGLAILLGLSFGVDTSYTFSNAQTINGDNFVQIDLSGTQIANGGSIAVNYGWIGSWDKLDAATFTCSSGNITTADVSWTNIKGVELLNQTLTFGTQITDFRTGWAVLTIYNPVGITINVTGSILINN